MNVYFALNFSSFGCLLCFEFPAIWERGGDVMWWGYDVMGLGDDVNGAGRWRHGWGGEVMRHMRVLVFML